MTARIRIASALVAAMILCGWHAAVPAYAQSPAASVEPSNDAEHALVAQHPDEWAQLNPEQRARVLENYRRWQAMRPEDRQRVQQNFQRFSNLPPEERQ